MTGFFPSLEKEMFAFLTNESVCGFVFFFSPLAAFSLAYPLINSSIWTSVISKISLCAATLSVFKGLYISVQTIIAGTSGGAEGPLVPGS